MRREREKPEHCERKIFLLKTREKGEFREILLCEFDRQRKREREEIQKRNQETTRKERESKHFNIEKRQEYIKKEEKRKKKKKKGDK